MAKYPRESPDLYRLSPASILNQQRRRLLTDSSDESRPISNVEFQDFADSIIKSIDNERISSRNGSLFKLDSGRLKSTWESIYHDQLPPKFRSIDLNKHVWISTRNGPNHWQSSGFHTDSRRQEIPKKLVENIKYNREFSLPLMRLGKQKPESSQIKKKFTKSSPPGTVQRLEFPGVRVSITSGNFEDSAEKVDLEKLKKTFNKKSRSIRLQPQEIRLLNLNPKVVKSARSYYFNPKYLSFTPLLIENKYLKS